MSRTLTLLSLAAIVASIWPVLTPPSVASARTSRRVPLFHIGRSNSRNVVHYALEVDGQCRASGDEPIKIYWRMHSKGPGVTEGLTFLERVRAYGLKFQKRVQGAIEFRFVAYPGRLGRVRTVQQDGKCRGEVWAKVLDAPAVVDRVWVKVIERRWWQLPKIPFVDVHAHRRDGQRIKERIVP